MNLKPFVAFIKERHAIYERRAAGKPWPWTEDKILQTYRFCNVYRNLDKETVSIHNNWLHPHAADPDVWFAMTVARVINWWPSLAAVGYPVPWKPAVFRGKLEDRQRAGEKVFTGAYMVSTNGMVMDSKITYVADYLLTPAWKLREKLRPVKGDTLEAFHARLLTCNGLGSFMAAQVAADVKYAAGSPLRSAPDWHTWAASGPGSRRGLNRLLGRPVAAPWTEQGWRTAFAEVLQKMPPLLKGLPSVTGQDCQNLCCEFDKYERVRLGEGRPRSLYKRGGA